MSAADIRPGDEVRAITLWEPYATLMALGLKTIETRTWSTTYRGPLLICAAKRRNLGQLGVLLCRDWNDHGDSMRFVRALGLHGGSTVREVDERLSYGKAVALVDVHGCFKTQTIIDAEPGLRERCFGDYRPGRYGWLTNSPRRLEPFPMTGKQGFFTVAMPDFEEWTP